MTMVLLVLRETAERQGLKDRRARLVPVGDEVTREHLASLG